MYGLVLKDLINLTKSVRLYFIVILLYGAMSFVQKDTSFFSVMFIFLFGILTLTSYSYDDLAKWDSYALTMPIDKKDIVRGKYLLLFVLTIIGTIFSMVGCMVLTFLLQSGKLMEGLAVCAAGAAVTLLFYSISLPLITKLGVEKARLICVAVYVLPAFGGAMIVRALKASNIVIPDQLIKIGLYVLDHVYVFVPIILLVLIAISYSISVKIYTKKEF